jgi:hypothetical protein
MVCHDAAEVLGNRDPAVVSCRSTGDRCVDRFGEGDLLPLIPRHGQNNFFIHTAVHRADVIHHNRALELLEQRTERIKIFGVG